MESGPFVLFVPIFFLSVFSRFFARAARSIRLCSSDGRRTHIRYTQHNRNNRVGPGAGDGEGGSLDDDDDDDASKLATGLELHGILFWRLSEMG